MSPKPFYEISSDRYLFGKPDEMPEEKVRQWALFELLSTYGVHINNIKIECPVKVGTRTHYADIVILRDGAPYVVIECKRWKNKKIDNGIDQAISYADANTMKAKFAVFTNGDIWRVKRKIRNGWVEVPDINRSVDSPHQLTIDEIISDIHELEPILYWFDQVVPKEDARAYFCALQEIFNSKAFPIDQIDRGLCFATDNLLRAISAKGAHEQYIMEKMLGACRYYSSFFQERLFTKEDLFELNKDDFFHLTTVFCLEFDRIVQKTQEMTNSEVLMFRFIDTLFHYFWNISKRQPSINDYIDVPVSLNDEFHKFLNFHFQIRMGIEYPDRLNNSSNYSLKISCEEAWKAYRLRAKE